MKKNKFKELDELEKNERLASSEEQGDEHSAYAYRNGIFGQRVYTEKKKNNYDHVPLYHSYGTFRKFGLPRKILETFYKVVATAVLIVLGFAALLTIISAILYAPLLISTTIVVIIATFFLYKPVRLLCKRFGFMLKVRRKCRKNGYILTQKRRFPKYFKHSNDQMDFFVDTDKKIYCVCFLTVAKYNTHIT